MKSFNLYCDESCHLQNDRQEYMLIAYTISSYNQTKLHLEAIKQIKAKHKFKNEIKWNSVSKSKYEFYVDLIDYFFASDLQFRSIVVKKENIKIGEGETFDDFYYKMYYQLLYHKMNMEYAYYVYLDIKDTLSAKKVNRLKDILNISYSGIKTVQNIRSEENLLMQLTDLFMGALSYHLRGLNKVIAKNKLIERLKIHTQLPLNKSTYKSYSKFNLFFIDLVKKD